MARAEISAIEPGDAQLAKLNAAFTEFGDHRHIGFGIQPFDPRTVVLKVS